MPHNQKKTADNEDIRRPTLEINGAAKRYQRRDGVVNALDNVSIRVERGKFKMVCGPSGSGKTTLLLAAGGLLQPDAGSVKVNGVDLYSLAPDARAKFRAGNIGFVFQQFHLVPYLSVIQNVAAAGLATAAANPMERAGELLKLFGLEHRAGHFPPELSTGERQRVALARALFNRPGLLLADEPTGNLDEHNANIALERFRLFAKEGGAVLMATHNTALAADEMIRLESGRLKTG